MAVAVYDSDLTAANGGELTIASNSANWDESSDGGWDDAGTMVDETNFYIQGAECISAQFTKTGVGTIINIQGTPFTVDVDGAILIWSFWASPSSLNTYALGGVRTLVGNSLGDFYAYKASGSDLAPNPIGGWANYAIDPASATIDTTVGTPDDTWTHVGTAISATAQDRGNPHAVDAIRVGRCTLEVTLGDATEYGTFLGMSNFDTSTDQRYALFQKIFGGYKWQGLMSLGTTAVAVDFRSSNANIFVENTPQVSSNFNKIEIHNATSNVEWTSISITSQDGVENIIAATASRGIFAAIDNATINKTTCTFTDMGTFTYLSNSTLTSTIYRRCNLVTQGGGTFSKCTFDSSNATTAFLVDNLTLVSDTDFASSGTGHAMELTTTGSYTWIGNTHSGYGLDGTTDAVVYNNSGGEITINVNSGNAPTVLNGTGASTIVQSSFTLTLTDIPADVNVTIVNSGDREELQHTVSTGANITYPHSGTGTIDILLNSLVYDPNLSDIYDRVLEANNNSIKFQLIADANYDNP